MQSRKPSRVLLLPAVMIAGLAWSAAAILWLRLSEGEFAMSLFGLGLSLGPCLVVYALVPGAKKQTARRLVLSTGGLSIMAFSLLGAVNGDLEGFSMPLFAGPIGIAVGHTPVTVFWIAGIGCERSVRSLVRARATCLRTVTSRQPRTVAMSA